MIQRKCMVFIEMKTTVMIGVLRGAVLSGH